jgi:hypothetical protein
VRVEVGSEQNGLNEPLLPEAMGQETANIHLGTRKSRQAVLDHLEKLQGDSLFAAAQRMVAATVKDWEMFTGKTRNDG